MRPKLEPLRDSEVKGSRGEVSEEYWAGFLRRRDEALEAIRMYAAASAERLIAAREAYTRLADAAEKSLMDALTSAARSITRDPILRAMMEGPVALMAELPDDVVDLMTIQNVTRSDDERLKAATNLAARWARSPIHRSRWLRVLKELWLLGEAHRRSPEDELRSLTINRFFEIAHELGPYTLEEIPRVVRRLLNRRITQDILGLEWRRRSHARHEVEAAAWPFTRVEAEMVVAASIRRAQLGDRELEILLRIAQGEPESEIAADLGMKPVTVRVTYHRTLKKLRAVV